MSILRKILFPFSLLYGLIMLLRNWLYDYRFLKTESFKFPVICVGNLSTGGTGKSPMIEYLLMLLLPNYNTATLSRGYGRKSNGFFLLNGSEKAEQVGDEPLQFKTKFPEAIVAVDEKRVHGIKNLQKLKSPQVVLLDDAFQHRKVKAGLYILLTTYNNLYIDDFMLPTGNLREPVKGAARAQIVVVTKCPQTITREKKVEIRKKLKLNSSQKLYFSFIEYSKHFYKGEDHIMLSTFTDKKVTLVTGIANPKPLCEFLDKFQIEYEHLEFPDHHVFSTEELMRINSSEKILTTEKDYMRLKGKIENEELYYIPIKMKFTHSALEFKELIKQYISNEK